MSSIVIEGCALAAEDDRGTEYHSGHIVIEGHRIAAVGPGGAPATPEGASRIDGAGCVATPGLVNGHHHLYQWLTRGMAQQATLFEWLAALYPVWAHLDEELQEAAARAALAALALSGCSTTTDHHYIFPSDSGDLLGAAIEAARAVGLRFHPCRGSMDLGASSGGLPPDEVTEERDEVLARTEEVIDAHHDASGDSMLRIAVAPCSPFSVTTELMREAAGLARFRGVRLHTHLAETAEEEDFCLQRFGVRPVDYLDELGWLGPDVWLAHCVHLGSKEVGRLGSSGTGVAHCPSSNGRLGAGIAPAAALLASGAPVGLGVDGAASNESGQLAPEMRQALLMARARGGPRALTARDALRLATMGGAACLGRGGELGSLEVGKLADVALWRLDDLGTGIEDPVANLVLGPPRRVEHLVVNGRQVVSRGELTTCDEDTVARAARDAGRKLLERAEAAR